MSSLVGIDCRFAATHSGIGRYIRELTQALLLRSDGLRFILFVRKGDRAWIPKNSSNVHAVVETTIAHYSLAEQWQLPAILRQSGIDLLFSPHFNLPFFCPVPFVMTVHDLILHRYPNAASLPRQLAYRLLLGRSVAKAKAIITVSDFSKQELMRAYGQKARDATTIHEGVSPRFTPQSAHQQQRVLQEHDIRAPYFLYVGNAKQHKNVQMLIDAFAAAGLHDTSLVLVTSGPEARALRLGPGVQLLADVPEENLPALYSAALCFVSASLYEGFGLPLLEAHTCGCPAIVTDAGAFCEIAPLGTVLLPSTIESFAAALRLPPARPPTIATYSWHTAAANTAGVFRRVLASL